MTKIPAKHWTEFLPEVGKPILKQGYRQLDRLFQIDCKEKERNQLVADYNQEEHEITQLCTTEWGTIEVANAKLNAILPLS